MLYLLHGDNDIASYTRLQALLSQARTQGQQVLSIAAKNLSETELEAALQQDSLFATERVVVVEGLHSLPVGARRKAMIARVSRENSGLILRDFKKLTANQLKVFPQAKVELFKLDSVVFKWLDTLGSKQPKQRQLELLHQAITQDSAEMCFAMLIRQIRLLIQVKDNAPPPMAPFQLTNFKRQANQLTMTQLFQYHSQLLTIDLSLKTSQNLLPLSATLELFTAGVYSQKNSISI